MLVVPDATLPTRSQETEEEVVAALATTTANAAAINMDIGAGYVAVVLSSVLFATKVMLF